VSRECASVILMSASAVISIIALRAEVAILLVLRRATCMFLDVMRPQNIFHLKDPRRKSCGQPSLLLPVASQLLQRPPTTVWRLCSFMAFSLGPPRAPCSSAGRICYSNAQKCHGPPPIFSKISVDCIRLPACITAITAITFTCPYTSHTGRKPLHGATN
jgi:hypothetical protein